MEILCELLFKSIRGQWEAADPDGCRLDKNINGATVSSKLKSPMLIQEFTTLVSFLSDRDMLVQLRSLSVHDMLEQSWTQSS